MIRSFEDIEVWTKSQDGAIDIYKVFQSCRDFSLRDQIQRAAVSVSNNIAEGYERQGNKEFKKFLFIAKGSSAEVRSMLYLSLELKYVNKTQFTDLLDKYREISRMLSAFIKALN